ncbi:homeobox-like domain superfamily [Holotrichia oblita]|uniref:Homeobox-like domain superfamily n=1 Tax=Holotrichia oblita TaxID=644536 RepID=A0ACB9THZ3_HOLOL|nr:homeobox-like domain superfamily [Holotrichia oblita]
MVRDYKKRTNRQSWSTEAMNSAVEAVISGQSGCLKASNQFDVPQSTLERYVKKIRENSDYNIDKRAGKFKNVFTEEQELELAMGKKNRGMRANWTEDMMSEALMLINKGMSQREVEKQCGIARTTLRNHIKSGSCKRKLGRRGILSEEEEH